MKNLTFCLLALSSSLFISCQNKKLPYLGEPELVKSVVDGRSVEVEMYPAIPDFAFTNQNGETVTGKSFEGKIYVADFFFTTCPTICPVMKTNMLKVYNAFQGYPEVKILSHSIDPDHDSVAVLKRYANDMGLKGTMWQFVTGDRGKIYDIGQKHYLLSAREDPQEPGGFLHSGHFVLIDKHKYVRGMYDGTLENDVKRLIEDINTLLEE